MWELERVDEIQGELVAELEALRRRLVELERLEAEHQRVEEALQRPEEKLHLIFDSIAEGITVTDLDGTIEQLNEAMVGMHGYDSKQELIGRNILELIAEIDYARAKENLQRALAADYVKDLVGYIFLTKDGRKFDVELSATVFRDASGEPIGFIFISEDVTERKRMEEQLLITDRLASIGELASGIAHELNNPLTSVIGFSQLLLSKDLPDGIREDIGVIYNEARRTAEVMKNLLTFARRHAPVKQLVNINNVIEKVLTVRAYEQKVENIQVITRLAPDLPVTMADYFQLQQVFLNIIINAEHFMLEAHQRGTLTITTQRIGSTIRASFTDDGPGIAKENLGHLFDPFFTTKEVGQGTGLGLSICHGIITEHNGRIYAEGEPGRGATFIVELPIPAEINSEGGSNE
jgi:two-component system NtrC family sensor kinase